jgi:hypothetical protein
MAAPRTRLPFESPLKTPPLGGWPAHDEWGHPNKGFQPTSSSVMKFPRVPASWTCSMFGRPVSPVSLDGEFKAAASAPVQISSEALPGETASPSSARVSAQLSVVSSDASIDVVDAECGRRLSDRGIIPRTQSAALVAHSQHDPESRHPSVSKLPKNIGKGMPAPSRGSPKRIRSKQPPAASSASPKRVRVETSRDDPRTPTNGKTGAQATRGTRLATERTPVKEAVTSSDVTSGKVSRTTGSQCEHGRRRKNCSDCFPCPCTAGEPVGNRRRTVCCADCNPCACTAGELVGNRRTKYDCSDCGPCECTKGKPAGERRRKGKCQDCQPCECTKGKPAGQRIRKDRCRQCRTVRRRNAGDASRSEAAFVVGP